MAWEFSSHDQLVEAGYVWRGYGVCRDCGESINWYTNVDRKMIPVNRGTYMIHMATCKPPQKKSAHEQGVESGKVVAFGRKQHALFESPPDKSA